MVDCLTLPGELVHDTRVLPVLTRLMGCVEQAMTEAGIPTCFSGIVSGTMADSTPVGPETDPMVWLRQGEVTPIVVEGAPNVMSCGIQLEVNVEIGFLTCYPVSADGDPLDVDENLAIASLVSAAMVALFKAIACCDWLKATNGVKAAYDVTGWAPAGPIGGVVGGAWTLQVIV
jgi:hypothetical protein